ncbi:TrlF family AAA-like ATPase [Methylocaldum sp. RMAD-M]|uniref:TrlF family AAA-like ATPase n=1 Tax=Methylocaldum sp. RMAD-M TaxID=2806557 RepID=UPI001AE4FD66|nr:AAA family ATPase [Methylocaldum sp. RMAD-M]MBP1152556.1 ABC-type lipoprotein export system ATPase subunit [Methylocaldum sp. RMAD-M]
MGNKYPKGSEWRIWDLHVHSPASANYTGSWEEYIIQTASSKCAVIGINDYFSVDGYKETLRRLDDPEESHKGNEAYREALGKLRSKALLPVVECRMDNLLVSRQGRSESRSGERINFHLIFNNEVNISDIERLIRSFMVDGQSIGNRYDDKNFLLNDVCVSLKEVKEQLEGDATFRGKYLLWLPYDEYGGIGNIDPQTDRYIKATLTKTADILGSSNQNQRDFFLWKNPRLTEAEYRQWIGKPKPCIKGSDTHSAREEIGPLKDKTSQPTNKYCWVKADPSFKGLEQILIEPEDRVYIGERPPKLVHVTNNRTNFLSSLQIRKKVDSSIDDAWFNCDLPLNHDMIAIIGNKGSGKSALADIIALAGNAHCDREHFSFLTPSRFCEKNNRISKHFELIAHWEDGTETTKSLSDQSDLLDVERIKYIPQKYLENVCTETAPGEQSEFQRELRKVIYSRIPEENRFDKQSLDELIAYKTEEIGKEIGTLKQSLKTINTELVRLEQKATSEYRQTLEARLKEKKQELTAHLGIKPPEVQKPDALTEEEKAASSKISEQLDATRGKLRDINNEIAQAQEKRKEATGKLEQLRKLEIRLGNFVSDFERLKKDIALEVAALDLPIEQILTLRTDYTMLNQKRQFWENEKVKLDMLLAEGGNESLLLKRQDTEKTIDKLKHELDAPNLRYQEYLSALQKWQQREALITGNANQADSLKFFEEQLRLLCKELPNEIAHIKKQQKATAALIYEKITETRNVYQQLFAPAQQLIQNNPLIKDAFRLSFDSSIVDRGFAKAFFDRFINQGVNGSFCGKEQGSTLLNNVLKEYDFNQSEDAMKFAEKIVELLSEDHRSEKRPKYAIEKQMKKNVLVNDLYDFLWSFDYLAPEYALKLDSKDLSQLSPGERGTLLLVFYLLVDRSNKPIVVDQPEENLDSHTVYRLLIPVIKEVKKTRQIIMVTHSPNIAVVCDAEQIIHASIDRAAGNCVTYTPGSIESPITNQCLIDVLEGTRPAFDNREAKYYSA